jgi:hypothetical protein
MVAAPMHIKKSERTVAPPTVKTKIDKVKLDKGWGAVGDEKAQTEFKQKIKTQDPHRIPTGAGPTGAGAAAAGGASVAPGASPAGAANVTGAASPAGSPAMSPLEKGRGQGKHAGEKADVTGAQAGGSPASEASPAGAGAGSRKGAKRGEMPMTGGSPAGVGATTESSPMGGSMVPEGGKHKAKLDRGNAGATEEAAKGTNLNSSKSNIYKSSTPPPTTAPLGAGEGTTQPGDQGQGGKHKGRQFDQPAGPQGAQGIQPTGDAQGAAESGRGRQKAKEVQPNYIQGGAPAATGAEGPGKGQGKGQGKKQQGEASPVPSPQ